MTQNNLATLYLEMYRRTGEGRYGEAAEAAYRRALEVLDPRVAPAQAVLPARSLARLRARQARWAEAHSAYETAITAAETRYRNAPTDAERRRVMGEHASLYREDARVLVGMGQLPHALARLDEGRAKALAEATGYAQQALARAGEDGRRRWREAQRRRREAEAEYQAAQTAVEGSPTPEARREALERLDAAAQAIAEAQAEVDALVQELGLEPPHLTPEAVTALPLPDDTAAVAFALTEDETLALILHRGEVEVVPLPRLSGRTVRRLVGYAGSRVRRWVQTYEARGEALRRAVEHVPQEALEGQHFSGDDARKRAVQAVIAACRDPAAARALREAQAAWEEALEEIAATGGRFPVGWWFAYRLAFTAVRGEGNRPAEAAAQRAFMSVVARTLAHLEKRLWAPLAEALPAGVQRVLLIPSGLLALLPLHAALPEGLETLTVAYAPSLAVWETCRRWRGERSPHGDLFIATPAPDLPFTAPEAEWLGRRFQALGRSVTHLDREQATAAAVAATASGGAYFHHSGHAGYRWDDPLESGLLCWDRRLTLRAIRQGMDLSRVWAVVLSACETGLTDVLASGEEFVGLPAGLLEAGAPLVLASLWPVHDVSTAFLMDECYRRHLEEGQPLAEALQGAAAWLRGASKAELLERIARSNLSTQAKGMVERLLEKVIALEQARMADAVGLTAADEVVSKPGDCPFAAPYYWAAFAAYGAV
jgi:CHAT domain-containing protein